MKKIRTSLSNFIMVLILIATIVSGILLGMLLPFYHHNKNAYTPLQWCVWEITSHEGYDELDYAYTYEKPNLPLGEKITDLDVYNYLITLYNEERIGYWSCFIECKCNHFLISHKCFRENEVKLIDCDLIYEVILQQD